jgi:hypothetical protein
MNTEAIIEALDTEIARLKEIKALLAASKGNSLIGVPKRGPGRPKKVASGAAPEQRRGISPEARERIATAQKARWAKVRKAAKKTAKTQVAG